MKKILLSLNIICLFYLAGVAQIPIAEARMEPQGQSNITIEGIVTNGSNLGDIRYIQDDTGALPFYTPDVAANMTRGDLVRVTGTMGEFQSLIQLVDVTDYEIISSGNPMPEPISITAGQMGSENESQLATISNAVFANGGDTFGFGTWPFVDFNGESGVIFVRNESPLFDTLIPDTPVNLTGIISIYQGSYQFLVRDLEDVEAITGVYVSKQLEQTNIQKTSFDLYFESSAEALGGVRYGLTKTFELGEIQLDAPGTGHSVTLEGLSPGELYYVQAYIQTDSGIANSIPRVFATESESSGEIQVYFNKPVDTSLATESEANYLIAADYEGIIIDFINGAQNTLDVAAYNINRQTILNALNAAHDNGVVVRYLHDDETFNEVLMNQAADFPDYPVLGDELMHNKFMIRDAESVDNSWILTGSTNFTWQNILDDANNLVLIQDQSLAKAYTLEFNEMWGTDEANTNINDIVGGPSKTVNTPQKFIINGSPVELYFSPTDNTSAAIIAAMESADHNLDFAILSFTYNDIGSVILDAHNNSNITVRGIMEDINGDGSEFPYLTDQGVNLEHHDIQNQIHHKYAIIDANNPDSDPTVVTGSHNWSNGAETRNDENTLVIHNAEIANIYLQEFNNRWCELTNGSCVTGIQNDPSIRWKLYPIPAADFLTIELQEAGVWSASIINTLGQVVSTEAINGNQHQIDVSNLAKGTYLLQLQDGKRTISKSISIVR